jgi:hypothetical protein
MCNHDSSFASPPFACFCDGWFISASLVHAENCRALDHGKSLILDRPSPTLNYSAFLCEDLCVLGGEKQELTAEERREKGAEAHEDFELDAGSRNLIHSITFP